MALVSRGYYSDITAEDLEKDWQLFSVNLDLLLTKQQDIFNCADYFFCAPAFANCSWPYVNGDGPLLIGYLLKAWQSDCLIEHCANCKGKVLITAFAGSPLSGSNSWSGLCISCCQKQSGKQSAYFRQWMDITLKLRKSYPDKVREEEEYDGFQFSFGGKGLIPTRKTRIVWKSVAEDPVTLQVLIEELKSGNIRTGNKVNVHLLKKGLELKPFSRS